MRALLVTVVWLLATTHAIAVELTRQVEFSVIAQPLTSAIVEFSKQAQIQVLADGQKLEGLSTKGVRGRLSIGEGLRAMLEGTGFGFKVVGSTTVSLAPAASASAGVYQAESIMVTAQKRSERAFD